MARKLTRLANKGILTLIVESGRRVHISLINAQLADELYLYMATTDRQRHFFVHGRSKELNGRRRIASIQRCT